MNKLHTVCISGGAGAMAAGLLASPIGMAGGALYGVAGSVYHITADMLFPENPSNSSFSGVILRMGKIMAAFYAANFTTQTLLGVKMSLESFAILHLTTAGVALGISLIAAGLILAVSSVAMLAMNRNA